MQTIEILETARKIVAGGKKKEAEDFIVAHFKELPEDIQGDLLIEFIKEAGSKDRLKNLLADVQESAISFMDALDKAEKQIKDLEASAKK